MNVEIQWLRPGQFSWNELVTTNEADAGTFYTRLFEWTAEPFGGGGLTYTLFKKDGTVVGGMMECPKPGLPAHWLAYVTCDDVDAVRPAGRRPRREHRDGAVRRADRGAHRNCTGSPRSLPGTVETGEMRYAVPPLTGLITTTTIGIRVPCHWKSQLAVQFKSVGSHILQPTICTPQPTDKLHSALKSAIPALQSAGTLFAIPVLDQLKIKQQRKLRS